MRFHENEEAVSPVIGVILMVAITVILAAVIAVFVFGMAGDVEGTKSVGATAKQIDDKIIVTYHGGPDHTGIDWVNATLYDANGGEWSGTVQISGAAGTSSVEGNPAAIDEPNVGATITFGAAGQDAGTAAQERIVVTAKFDSGYEQVVLDQTL